MNGASSHGDLTDTFDSYNCKIEKNETWHFLILGVVWINVQYFFAFIEHDVICDQNEVMLSLGNAHQIP